MDEWNNYVKKINNKQTNGNITTIMHFTDDCETNKIHENNKENSDRNNIGEHNFIYQSVILPIQNELSNSNNSDNNDDKLLYEISTMTMSSKIMNCELNLVNIGKYLEIDNDIIGIKYSYGNICFSRGIYTTTNYKKSKKKEKTKINQQLFYNQISLIVHCNDDNDNKQINVKLFSNGSLHITGCKNVNNGKYVTELIYNKLKKMSNQIHTIILSCNAYGVLLDSNNFIYKRIYEEQDTEQESSYSIFGYYDPNTNIYIMNNKEYIIFNKIKDTFISKKNEQKMKSICNNNGDNIGIFIYCKHKKQYIIKLNCNNDYNDQHNTETQSIADIRFGSIKRDYYKIINYKCNPFLNEYPVMQKSEESCDVNSSIDKMIKVNIDCINITYQLPYLINRNKLYEYFIKHNYICKYNPQTYSGIKFIYKYPIYNTDFIQSTQCMYLQKKQQQNSNNGLCNCNVKCICLNITFLIFRSGNIIVTGFKDLQQINSVLNDFNTIMYKFSECK